MSVRLFILLLGVMILCGCESSEKAIPPQPEHITPTSLLVSATLPSDSNANGYIDSTEAWVYISSNRYAMMLKLPGTFQFRLLGKGDKELAKWEFDEATTGRAARPAGPGPVYVFNLNMLETSASDKIDAQGVSLEAIFRPKEGNPVHAPLTPLLFGKTHM